MVLVILESSVSDTSFNSSKQEKSGATLAPVQPHTAAYTGKVYLQGNAVHVISLN